MRLIILIAVFWILGTEEYDTSWPEKCLRGLLVFYAVGLDYIQAKHWWRK